MTIEFIGFTADSRIVGSIPLADDRLSDMLNSVGRVVIRNASVEDIDLGHQDDGPMVVPCGELLVVVGTGRRGLDSRRRRTVVRRVQVGLGRYIVTGNLHIAPGARISSADDDLDALLVGRDLLVPLTDAAIRYTRAGARHTEQWDAVLINRVEVEWIKAVDAGDDGAAADDEDVPAEDDSTGKTRYAKDFTRTVAD
jgi:hypothetical protein